MNRNLVALYYYMNNKSEIKVDKQKEIKELPKPKTNQTKIITKEEKKRRTNIFNKAKKTLKELFFGIDEVIDKIFAQIETWYIYPEYLIRPTIINLYGLTGVGKTDFVRKLSKLLELNDKTCIIELDCNSKSAYDSTINEWSLGNDSIFDELKSNDIRPDDKSILLLDEIHRFNSEKGKYGDIWKLLSDGFLYNESMVLVILKRIIKNLEQKYNDIKNDMMNTVDSFEEKMKYKFGINTSYQENIKPEDLAGKMSRWTIERFKNGNTQSPLEAFNKMDNNITGHLNTLDTIIKYDYEDYQKLKTLKIIYQGAESMISFCDLDFVNDIPTRTVFMRSCSNKVLLEWFKFKFQRLNEEAKNRDDDEMRLKDLDYIYSKMLIFICGNLGKENYSNGTPSADEVKTFLKKSFRAEQISRFGNNYIVYPILNKEHYDRIISKEIKSMEEKLQQEYNNKNIKIDPKEVEGRIELSDDYEYEGVRPIYSAVYKAISEILPSILIKLTEK